MKQTELKVEGMGCPSCIGHIDEALQDIEGVAEVEVRLSDGKVLVHHNSGGPPVERMIAALREAGYEASASA